MDHAVILIDTICMVAGSDHFARQDQATQRLRDAITRHDTATIFEHLAATFAYQGISDAAAYAYMEAHGRPRWHQIKSSLASDSLCSKLERHRNFDGCGFRKTAWTCSEPERIQSCPLPRVDLRNGTLNQNAYSLYLFIRDIADNDLVEWIDKKLAAAHEGPARTRLARMKKALIGPMRSVFGVSDKTLSMAMSDLLMAAPRTKRHWFETGASMIVIDTLVHNFLHRTGIARRFNAEHAYGSCYRKGGCADIIAQVSNRIDARKYNPKYPAQFSRFISNAVWRYCAEDALSICQGNRIPMGTMCCNQGCFVYAELCDRVRLHE